MKLMHLEELFYMINAYSILLKPSSMAWPRCLVALQQNWRCWTSLTARAVILGSRLLRITKHHLSLSLNTHWSRWIFGWTLAARNMMERYLVMLRQDHSCAYWDLGHAFHTLIINAYYSSCYILLLLIVYLLEELCKNCIYVGLHITKDETSWHKIVFQWENGMLNTWKRQW